jgi:ATP-dependent DNA helicase HFM1/MER3
LVSLSFPLYVLYSLSVLDEDGIAVIMCEAQLESKYRALVQGRTILESSLHLNLAEHLNAEIGLGTITNVSLAKEWLHNSFLFQRIKRNPRHYAITMADGHTTTAGDELVLQSIEQLEQTQLVQKVKDIPGGLCSTQFGEIMSKVSAICLVITQGFIRSSVLYSAGHGALRSSRIFR